MSEQQLEERLGDLYRLASAISTTTGTIVRRLESLENRQQELEDRMNKFEGKLSQE